MVTEMPQPIIATINHVIDFVASLVEEPLTLNRQHAFHLMLHTLDLVAHSSLRVLRTAPPYTQRNNFLIPRTPPYTKHSWGCPLHRVLPLGKELHSLALYHHHCRYSPSLYHEVAQTTRPLSDDDESQPWFLAPPHSASDGTYHPVTDGLELCSLIPRSALPLIRAPRVLRRS